MCSRCILTALGITRVAVQQRRRISQNTQHNKQTMTTLETLMMRLKLQRTAAAAAAAAAVAVRAPSPQANERRMAKEKTDTYMEERKK